MGLSVFFVRVTIGGYFGWQKHAYYKVGASHYATAAQRAIREALKSRRGLHTKKLNVRISRSLARLQDPDETPISRDSVGRPAIPSIGKFPTAATKSSHAGKKSIREKRGPR